jgi:isoleucyl-tRNA synthetase
MQQARRDAQLDVTDRVTVSLAASPEVVAAVEAHRDFVAHEVLATELGFDPAAAGFEGEVGEGEKVVVSVTPAR